MTTPSAFLTLKISALSDSPLIVDAAYGHEAISEMYEYRVFVRLPAGETVGTDETEVVGQSATFEAHDADGVFFRACGMVTEVQLSTVVRELNGEAACLYELVLAPHTYPLSLGRSNRVFVGQHALQIADTLLEGHPNVEKHTMSEPSAREHVCQYRESGWTFLNRILEREAIAYHFGHSGDGDREVLHLVGSDLARPKTDDCDRELRFVEHSSESALSGSDVFWSVRRRRRATPSDVLVRNHDYLHPDNHRFKLGSDASGLAAREYFFTEDGRREAEWAESEAPMRAARHRIEADTTVLRGTAHRVRAGQTFKLTDHPADSLNQTFLAVACRFYFQQRALPNEVSRTFPRAIVEALQDAPGDFVADGPAYLTEVHAVPDSLTFVPARKTPQPNIRGFERAWVDGASEDSDYAQIDEHGRYLVRFIFDYDDDTRAPAESSAYLRMMQPHAGDIEGFHFPLRRGTEVMVAFVGGHPDSPVIVGAVPNALAPSPVTDKNHTQNVIKTGGKNHITFEDKEGKEWIFMGSPNEDSYLKLGLHPDESAHVRLHTEASSAFSFGGDWAVDVGGALRETVKGSVTEIYQAGTNTDVKGDRIVHVQAFEIHNADVCFQVATKTHTVAATTLARFDTPKMQISADNYLRVSSNTNVVAGAEKHTADSLDLTVAGSTVLTTGSVTGNVAAVSLQIPGGVDITTPAYKVIAPDWKWFKASTFGITGKSTSLTGFSQSNTAMSVSTMAVGASIVGSSGSVVVFEEKKAGTKINLSGTVTTSCGATVTVSGAVIMG